MNLEQATAKILDLAEDAKIYDYFNINEQQMEKLIKTAFICGKSYERFLQERRQEEFIEDCFNILKRKLEKNESTQEIK